MGLSLTEQFLRDMANDLDIIANQLVLIKSAMQDIAVTEKDVVAYLESFKKE